MTNPDAASLFGEFPSVDHAQWKAKVLEELQGTAFDSLVWQTPDGFDMEPWYNSEHAETVPEIPFTGTTNRWRICQLITVNDPQQANEQARQSLEHGADTLEFRLCEHTQCNASNLSILLSGIDLASIPVYFSGITCHPGQLLEQLLALPGFSSNSGGILYNPQDAEPCAGDIARSPLNFSLFAIDTEPCHLEGATATLETAIALAGLSDLLCRFTAAGIDAKSIASKLELVVSAGSSHFTELAKLRALRLLWPKVLEGFGLEAASAPQPKILARSSARNTSLLDPYTNILRLTTEAVSSILGGCDTLQLGSFDPGGTVPGDQACRITRNIHLILREESGLDRVVDPAAGSYYIESLTAKHCRESWNLFLEFEAAGGLSAAINSGMLAHKLQSAADARKQQIRTRKKSLIGVNRYAVEPTPETENNFEQLQSRTDSRLLLNDAAGFERLRLNAMNSSREKGPLPPVVCWVHGDPARSFRVASFAEDFFRCGGFPVTGTIALDLHPDSCIEALKNKPAILVLCWAGKDDLLAAPAICSRLHELDSGLLIVVAGKPPKDPGELHAAGIDSFIHSGSDAFESLLSFQNKTGVL
jgi:methylmalonyl-CoA mutase